MILPEKISAWYKVLCLYKDKMIFPSTRFEENDARGPTIVDGYPRLPSKRQAKSASSLILWAFRLALSDNFDREINVYAISGVFFLEKS